MTDPRKPAAFRLDGDERKPPEPEIRVRSPRAVSAGAATVTPAEIDVFDEQDEALVTPPPATPRRRSKLGAVFLGAFGLLLSLAFGIWTDQLIRTLFSRSDWLGWLAAGVAAIAAVSFVLILIREMIGLARLGSVEKLRARGISAITRDDRREARQVVAELTAFVAARPETAAGRRSLKEMELDVIDGADLVRIAEAELLAPLDAQAQKMILDAAKRVSIVTAVSPRALVDLAYVVFEAGRLIRRLAELYGGRPGTLGFIRLSRDVLAHLAVTGVIAAGDEFIHQIVGQGLAARLSAKLGEGVVNGMMTARIGVAAMETVRPLPFTALRRPGMGDFLAALSTFVRRQDAAEGRKAK